MTASRNSISAFFDSSSHCSAWLQSYGNTIAFDSNGPSTIHNAFAAGTEAPSTVVIEVLGPIDPYRFNMFMADLLAERGTDIKRMSGNLCVQVSQMSLWLTQESGASHQ